MLCGAFNCYWVVATAFYGELVILWRTFMIKKKYIVKSNREECVEAVRPSYGFAFHTIEFGLLNIIWCVIFNRNETKIFIQNNKLCMKIDANSLIFILLTARRFKKITQYMLKFKKKNNLKKLKIANHILYSFLNHNKVIITIVTFNSNWTVPTL